MEKLIYHNSNLIEIKEKENNIKQNIPFFGNKVEDLEYFKAIISYTIVPPYKFPNYVEELPSYYAEIKSCLLKVNNKNYLVFFDTIDIYDSEDVTLEMELLQELAKEFNATLLERALSEENYYDVLDYLDAQYIEGRVYVIKIVIHEK